MESIGPHHRQSHCTATAMKKRKVTPPPPIDCEGAVTAAVREGESAAAHQSKSSINNNMMMLHHNQHDDVNGATLLLLLLSSSSSAPIDWVILEVIEAGTLYFIIVRIIIKRWIVFVKFCIFFSYIFILSFYQQFRRSCRSFGTYTTTTTTLAITCVRAAPHRYYYSYSLRGIAIPWSCRSISICTLTSSSSGTSRYGC